MYPVMLNVREKPCLVVGGGGVALRKVEGLLSDGAKVRLIAPQAIDRIVKLAAAGDITLEERAYRTGEAASYALVFAATDDREVNRQVFEDADNAGVWVNVADDPELCSFHLPARVQRGALQIAIASAGEAPFVVRRLRQVLEKKFGPEWAEWVESAARFRNHVRELNYNQTEQENRYDSFFNATVDTKSLSARVPVESEERALLKSDTKPIAGAKTSADDRPSDAVTRILDLTNGFVSLVGAGPGDPGLLTIRGKQRLMEADAVVYDNLAATSLPCDLPPQTELHCVGKRAGHHPVPQEEIQALLVRLAGQGKKVVRLKGGDPYVFGRGGEEAEELAHNNIPFEVIPCVTAAVAVPAYAGIPVTHRGEVVRVTMVTAHESKKKHGPQVRWDLLAKDPHAMLLGYMGVTSLPGVVKKLLEAGLNPNTPAAMIERGTTSRQRTVKSTVAELPDAIKKAGLKPPALFAIGPPIARAKNLDWFQKRPLFGERLILAAPAADLGKTLSLNGAEILAVPLPVSAAARVALTALPLTGCVLRSADEVDALDEERQGPTWGPDTVAWCLTSEAADRAKELGWQNVEQIQASHGGTELVHAMVRRRAR